MQSIISRHKIDADGAAKCMHPKSTYCTDCEPKEDTRDYDQEQKDSEVMLEE